MANFLKSNGTTHAHKPFTVKRLSVQSFYRKISYSYTLSIIQIICNDDPHTHIAHTQSSRKPQFLVSLNVGVHSRAQKARQTPAGEQTTTL